MSNQTATPGEQPDDDFDRLYALDEKQEGESGGETQGEGVQAPPATVAGSDGSEVTGGQAASGEDGAGGGSSASASPGATDVSQEEADWIATLPKEAQERIAAERSEYQKERQVLEDRYKALHGRLTPTQQALADAQRRLAQLPQQPQQPATIQQPAGTQTQEAADSFYDSPIWKKFATDYPGDAEVMRAAHDAQQAETRKHIATLESRVQQLDQRLEQTHQVASRTVANDEESKLDEAHSDWRELNNSDEYWEWFDGWRANQPKSMRDQFYDPAKLNVLMNDSDFLIARISEYKASRPAPVTQTAATTTQQTQTDSTQTPDPATQATQQQSDVRVRMSVAPEVRGSSPIPQGTPTEGLTEAELFEHLYAQD